MLIMALLNRIGMDKNTNKQEKKVYIMTRLESQIISNFQIFSKVLTA